jgi:hypothetical protein
MEVPMVPVTSLIIPVLISSVLVFLASFVIHMVLAYHRSDLRKLADQQEDLVMETLRHLNLPPGDYGVPHPGSPDRMRDPAFVAKMQKGPVILMNVSPGSSPALAKNLTQWFIYTLVVGVFAAYITGRAVGPGIEYLTVFRFVGTTAFMGYSLALLHESIWYKRSWVRTAKSMFDGLVYALLTAGVFGWLWPGRP